MPEPSDTTPTLPESVTEALKAYHDEMLIMVHDAVIGVIPPSNKGLLRLYELRRAIAAAIKRARAIEQDRLRVNKVSSEPTDIDALVEQAAGETREGGDAK